MKHDSSGVAVELLSEIAFMCSHSCLTKSCLNHIINLLHTTPCYVSLRDTLTTVI